MIHVCYGLHDKTGRYSKFTGTSMLSVFENTSAPPHSVMVHILHDNSLSQENYERFVYIAGKYGQLIKFYNVEKLCANKLQFLSERLSSVFSSRFSAGTFYRLMVDKKFFQPENVSKIIYLDSDTIVNLDITELWNYPMNDATIAAVPEMQATHGYMITNKHLLHTGKVKVENYFCAGIITIDLEKLDPNFFYRGVQWLSENNKCECFDQDILNNFFTDTYCKLPEKFDSFVGVAKGLDKNTLYPKIYHYAGNMALGFDMRNAHDKLFFSNFVKTPWFSENTILHLFDCARQIYVERQNFTIDITVAMSGKERAFFILPKDEENVKKIFKIKDNEEILKATSNESLQDLINRMKKVKGKKLFYIAVSFEAVRQALLQAGFSQGYDFIDARLFLSDINGSPLMAHPVLSIM